MFSILVIFLLVAQAYATYLPTDVSAYTYGIAVSDLVSRQVNNVSSQCNATCNTFELLNVECPTSSPHCHCNVPFISAQGNCLLCQTETATDQASVQFLLDEEMAQCRSEGIEVNAIHIQLPQAAAEIVRVFNVSSQILRRMQTAFLALQISGGHIGLVIIFVSGVFSRRVNRDPTFINFCLTWIFSSVVFSLSLYKGVGNNTTLFPLEEISLTLCLAQAILTAGAQALTACSTLAWIIQLWITLRAVINGSGHKPSIWIKWTLILSPYGLFIALAIPATFVGQRSIAEGNSSLQLFAGSFYCLIGNSFLARVVYGVMLACLMTAMVFDIMIINILYRHWRAFRSINIKGPISFSILLRVMTFSVFRIGVAM
ncbi:hypothetical protein K439DRAFT_1661848 [Ramaria rubella]|nr:hypothetical protein K439DRAFT_1661848 [Ramaria rubella]